MRSLSRQSSPSIAKITRPIPTGTLPRKRLFDHLDDCMQRPVVWISGPAGCGKTTLISSYLEARKRPCIWYQVDQGDSDLSTFFYYMGLAAKKEAPKRKPLPLLTPEYLQGLPTFTLRYFERLCTFLKPPFAIVLDNYERVPDDSPFHEMIRWGVDAIPQGINVIINSRRQSPPQFASLQAGEKLDSLGWDDIRFTRDESREMIQKKGYRTVTEEVVGYIYEKTEGWAAGLILMIQANRTKGIDLSLFKGMTPEEIYSYFETELFNKTDPNIQVFLLKTAFLAEMTAEMATSLTDMTQSTQILQTLNRSNFFIQSHLLDNPIYQYHSLFREYLIFRAKKTFPEKDLSSIKRKAATILVASHHYEEAAHLFIEDNAWQEMTNLILGYAKHLVAQGRFTTLQDWLSGLPAEILNGDPWLVYWMGVSMAPFDPAAGEIIFSRAFEMFSAKQEPAGMLLAWSGVVSAIAYSFDDLSHFDMWIKAMDCLKPLYDTIPVLEVKARVAASMVTALAFRQPWHPELETWAAEILNLPDDQIDVNIKIQTLIWYSLYRWNSGRLRDARAFLDLLQRLVQRPDASFLSKINCHLTEVTYYQLCGLQDESSKIVNKALTLSETTGIHVMDRLLYSHALQICLNKGDLQGATNCAKQLDAASKTPNSWEGGFYHFTKSRKEMIEGNLTSALHHQLEALRLTRKAGAPFNEGYAHAFCAQTMHQPGQKTEAEHHLEEALRIADQLKSRYLQFLAFYAHARLALAWNDLPLCLKKLSEALSLGKDEQYLTTLFDDPSVTARLCALALEYGIEVEYAREIIRRQKLVLNPPPLHIDHWPWPLKVFTMGRFELHQNGNTLQFSRKTQKKPLEMLKALIAFGGKEIGEEQIADLLWPEADGDAAYSAFTTNLSRLRHLLGYEKAIRYHDGRITLDAHSCWVDAWAFEHMVSESEKSWKEDPQKMFVLAQKAIDLYQGHFLASEGDTFWAVTYRERLRDKYLRLVMRIGEHHKKTDQWEEALACFLKGIDVDPLVEEFYQQMMVCYEKLGQQSRALEVYQRCKRMLASTLGCDPSPKTQALYRSLRTSSGSI
jgi:LuxR family maltose regulon positive regulatory protein